jgi:hypothetical protein
VGVAIAPVVRGRCWAELTPATIMPTVASAARQNPSAPPRLVMNLETLKTISGLPLINKSSMSNDSLAERE